MNSEKPKNTHFATRCVHGFGGPDPATGAISIPIYQTLTFAFEDVQTAAARFSGEDDGYIYTRLRNPTTDAFEQEMASLEGGEAAAAFASGMSAIAMGLLTLVKPEDKIVSARTMYGGTHALFEGTFKRLGIDIVYVDGRDAKNFARAFDNSVKAFFVETPANPTLCIVDIVATAEIAHARGVPLMVDNTFGNLFLNS